MTSWQKAVKYLAIAFAVFLAVCIIGGIVTALSSLSLIFGSKNIAGEMQVYNISDEVTDLKIDISAADLEITTGDTMKVESNHKYLSAEVQDGRLTIKEKKKIWNISGKDVKISLTVPQGYIFKNVDIDTGAGRVSAESLAADELSLELGAGETQIGSLTALASAKIDGGAGKLTINGGTLTDLDLDMGVGELNLESRLSGRCKLDYGIGAANLVLIGSIDDYEIEVDKGLGDATIEGETIHSDSIYGSGKSRVYINGGIGAIRINFKNQSEIN